jgi:beta-lactamase regulating signal transducer with metallopeptidase domain
MVEYLIKTTISLTIFYGFYHILLRKDKIHELNRYFLLFSLIISLTIPLITIKNIFYSEFKYNLNGLISDGREFQSEIEIDNETFKLLTIKSILIALYLIISITMLFRFVTNIYKLINTIKNSQKIIDNSSTIVLIDKRTLPYSFFKFIFVNRTDYLNANIDEKLLAHEKVHGSQFHTLDVLVFEFVKVFLWINPIIWFYKKEIQLIHEYLSDNKVLLDHDLNDYQNTIINLACKNNSIYLACNFNYSYTKKRIIMMTNRKSKNTTYKIVFIPIVTLLIFYFISCTKESVELNEIDNKQENDEIWWSSILLKHDVTPRAYNGFYNMVEMGTTNSITNGIVKLENAFFLIRQNETLMIE